MYAGQSKHRKINYKMATTVQASLLVVRAGVGPTEREVTPTNSRRESVCSYYFWEPSTQPGGFSVRLLHAQGPGEIPTRWVRGTQSWPEARVL